MCDLGGAVEVLIADIGGVADYGLNLRNLLAGPHVEEVTAVECGLFGLRGRLEKGSLIDVGTKDLFLGGFRICSELPKPPQGGFEEHESSEAGIEDSITWQPHRPINEGDRHLGRSVEGPERLSGFALRERRGHPSDFMDAGGSLGGLEPRERVLSVHKPLSSGKARNLPSRWRISPRCGLQKSHALQRFGKRGEIGGNRRNPFELLFSPTMERDFGAGWSTSEKANPTVCRGSADGARRIRTADLLGAIQGGEIRAVTLEVRY